MWATYLALGGSLDPEPVRRVLSSIADNNVSALLMGGQACLLYGAAEFSRDADLAILASPANLKRLKAALADLQASVIAVPGFEAKSIFARATPFIFVVRIRKLSVCGLT